MAEEKQAVAEGILERISREEWPDLDLLFNRTGDVQFWVDVMRYELDLGRLMTKGLLRPDATLDNLKDFHVHSMSPFHYAGMRGATDVLRRGLQAGLNVEVGLRNGASVLHLASFAGQVETVALLVDEFKARVNREDGYRCCPLHYASSQGHQRVVEFLVSRGADIGARDCEGATAAYHARKHRQHPVVSYLLDIYGDGDILLVEEQSPVNEVHTAAPKLSPPLYAISSKKPKKRLPALDYEEVELSSDRDSTVVETVIGSQDASDKSRPTDKKKDAKKTEKRMVYENTEFPLVSTTLSETGGHEMVSKTRHSKIATDISSCDEKRNSLKTAREDVDLISHYAENTTSDVSANSFNGKHQYDELNISSDPDSNTSKESGRPIREDIIPTIDISKFVRRPHPYEEITIPWDEDQNKIQFDEQQVEQGKFIRRPHLYEEIKLCDEDPDEIHLDEQVEQGKFVRRPHKYEEINLSCDEDPNKTNLDEYQIEQEVRQLLRKEMKKLELTGNAVDVENFFRTSDKDLNGSNVLNVREIAEDVTPDSRYDASAVITLRQLQRVLHEEFERFADQQLSMESVSKLRAKNNEDLKTDLTSASTDMPSATVLYDELTFCNLADAGSELGKIEAITPPPRREITPREDLERKEKKQRDDSPTSLPQRTDKRKLEITEQTNKESKLNFSPLILRRDPRNRREKGTEDRSPHRSPLRLKAQNDNTRETNEPKTEQNLQKSDVAKAGQSQFYVSLENNKTFSEI